MSKMVKAIAALGVVAGLGVAAMPLSSYASMSASGNVDITAKVTSGISLTLTRSANARPEGADATTDSVTYSNPPAVGDTNYDPTNPSTPSAANTLPLNVSFGEIAPGAAVATRTVTAKVTTNMPDGYKLNIKAAGETGYETALKHDTTTDTIAALAHNADLTEENFNKSTTSAWGYKVGTGNYNGVTASEVQIASSSTPVSGEATDITFGIKVVSGQKEGNYKGSVTITATAGN